MVQTNLDSALASRYRRSSVRLAVALGAVVLLALWDPPTRENYLGLSFTLWHTILESIAIVIGGMVFGVCWNTYNRTQPRALLILGCASLGAALLDLVHTLSFTGMPDLITPNNFGKAFVLYFAARILIASALVAVASMTWSADDTIRQRYPTLIAVLAYVVIVSGAVLFVPQYVPLTDFGGGHVPVAKVVIQGLLALFFAATALLFRRRIFRDRDFDAVGLFEATAYMALAELTFLQVGQLSDATIILGHLMKVAGAICIYRAIFVQGIQAPYQKLAASQERLKSSEEDLRTVTDNLPALIAFIDKNLVYRFANRNYALWLGLEQGSVVGRTLAEVVGRRHANALLPRLKRALRGETFTYDYQFQARGRSTPTWLNITYMPRLDAQGSVDGIYVLTLDVTERRVAEDHAAYIARHDELTGLPNRLAFKDAVKATLAADDEELDHPSAPDAADRAERSPEGRTERRTEGSSAEKSDHAGGPHFAILFIDVDRFKTVNDTLGHDAGDKLLQVVAERLRRAVRSEDLVARMGGDELCVLLRDTSDRDYVSEFARRVRHELMQPLALTPALVYKVTVSIGIAMYPGDGSDGEALLKNADIAMYQAKASGRDQYRFFQLEAEEMARRRMELELGLQTALSREELTLLYQPILDIRSARVVGLEALLRWNHPTHGLLLPHEFIALAEELGLIVPIGEWVLERAAQALAEIDARVAPGLFMSVNISAHQFQSPSLLGEVEAVLARHHVNPRRFRLELTESAMMEHADEARRIMFELRALGVQLSIDDFGTGYSSLAHLKRFPVDALKIDRSFVKDLPDNADDTAIATAIIAVGHALGLTVVAEGVESEAQLAFLSRQGCDLFQGFLEAPPMSIEALVLHLAERTLHGPGSLAAG